MPGRRPVRLANLIQEKIASLILDGSVKDPRVDSFISITRVEVSKDLSYADVFVSSFKSAEGPEKGAAGLQAAAPFIQKTIFKSMRVRVAPRLRFHADRGIQEAFFLNQKIDALVKET
ncbi:MAG: 30S ribosome-binding factor RbfA [Spirochaetaceae bacterium]|jgi:ribosome-binding factor A|nr:30S ribosome-binding factor RbfA [Spirochaetaceae bacterium]